tara:strand:- start:529 stop:2475 length:1947 start_codon:yes stop_codon:yes gene_type:complete
MTNIRNALMQAAGSASGDPVYVEDVFSVDLSVGTGSAITVNNGIDLSGEGGLVIWRRRDGAENWAAQDTERGVSSVIYLDSTAAEQDLSTYLLASFNNNGFTTEANAFTNGGDIASWTFRKQEGFFDIVTYTGNGTAGREISHNLGSTPGMIAVKALGRSENWLVYHANLSNPDTKILGFNLNNGEMNQSTPANLHSATATKFEVGNDTSCNNNGDSYVAYLWASGNDSASQIFGDDGDEAIVKTGTFTTDGSGDAFINLGFEPQFVLLKGNQQEDWIMFDIMRGMPVTGNEAYLAPNSSTAETTSYGNFTEIKPNGFNIQNFNANITYYYVAIRRGPMKEPTAGTDVYKALAYTGTSASSRHYDSALLTDMFFHNSRQTSSGSAPPQQYPNTSARFYSPKGLATHNNNAQFSSVIRFDKQTGIELTGLESVYEDNGTTHIFHMFRRYPKVFDVVFYEGTGSSLNVAHNLNATPELIIIKKTTESSYAGWAVYYGTSSNLILNKDNATGHWYSNAVTAASSTTFTAAANTDVNDSTETHIAYLFASLDGISKVGTYSGTGNDVNVTGLGAAARFVLIKRTDSTGDWYIFDSTRGIVSGDDPYLLINSTGIEVTNTDYIDPHSSGFTITSSAPAALNTSGGTYLYLAFA